MTCGSGPSARANAVIIYLCNTIVNILLNSHFSPPYISRIVFFFRVLLALRMQGLAITHLEVTCACNPSILFCLRA